MLPVWHNFFSIESRFVEGLALLEAGWERLVTAVGGATAIPPTLAADWLGRTARTHLHLGQIAPATALLGQALAVLDGLAGEESRRGTLIGYQAIPAFYGGDFGRAIALAEQSLALATAVDDEEGRLFATSFLGSCHKAVGNYGAATAAFTQAADLYQSVGDELGRGMMLNNLGNVAQAVGDFATAQAHYLACTAIFQTHQHTYGAATALANAGRLANKLGDGAQAKRLLQESLSLKRELRDGRGTAVALIGLADTAVAARDFAAVRTYLREAIPLATQAGDVKLTLEGQAVEVALAHAEGRHEAAHTLAAELLANPALSQEVRERVVMGVFHLS
jgi:tetratricopeptide (TPR) repeat protein